MEEVGRYSRALNKHLKMLQNEVRSLEKNKGEVLSEKTKLEREQKELEDRKKIYQFSIGSKKKLVQETKNDEKTYQKQKSDLEKQRLELLQEVYEYESRIEYLRDPKSVPEPKKGLLLIPFDIKPRITQRFGNTAFARANAYRYGKPFHDGMDFGTPTGTRLLSSADGVIVGTGNTDLVRSCQSWGKWILIEHPFGLSTLYAHLSLIKVRTGQKVEAGGLIGYTGNTGNSTGPHLHFGVYDSNGIRSSRMKKYQAVADAAGFSFLFPRRGRNWIPQNTSRYSGTHAVYTERTMDRFDILMTLFWILIALIFLSAFSTRCREEYRSACNQF